MNTAGPARQGSEDFFVDYRLDREKSRGRQVEILEAIVNNPSSAVETRKTAQEKLLEISGSISKEARVENLLKAKGYDEAVVCLDQRGVTVVMESQGLTPAEEAGLIEMVSRETGFGEQGIIIVPRKR
jgi:stage III sporulation protein AH